MFTIIVYLLFLIFVYAVDGASFYFWLMAGMGIFVVAGSLIGVIVPGKKTKPETEVRHGKAGRQSATAYPRLIPFEPMVIGERTENEKFWDAVRWYNIANSDW